MAGFWQDLRSALRQLGRSPGFTVTAVLMLALGICANSTAFSWINGTMLNPVPGARNPEELVTVMRGVWSNAPSPPFSYPDYRDLREQNRSLRGMLGYHDDWMTLTGGEAPQRIYAAMTSANYFDVLGVQPLLGRFFRPEEEAQAGGMPYVVLGYALWRTRFGADPAVVGRTLEINRQPFTVIGVAPAGFIGCKTGIRTDAWMPLAARTAKGANDWAILHRENAWLNVMARLRPGVTRRSATEDLAVLMRRLVAEYPDAHQGANTITLDPLWRSPFGANVYLSAVLPVLLAMAGVVLVLTCVNIATLALVRSVARRREIAIRQSLGAGRLEMMRQTTLEGLLVSAGGGLLAIGLTAWTARILGLIVPPNANPIVLSGSVDGRVMGAVLLLVVAASIVCGVLPAWRSSQVPVMEILKEEAASASTSGHHRHLLGGLVTAQIALSLALLVAAGLFLRTLREMNAADPGFDQEHVLTASVGLGTMGDGQEQVGEFQRRILDRVKTMPGISAASVADWLPLNFTRKTMEAYPEGYVPQRHESGEVRRVDVTAGYFATLKIPVLQGRPILESDDEDAPPVAVVDETAAAHYWPGRSAVGQRLKIWGRDYTVVGLAKNSRHQRVEEKAEPLVYLSLFQSADSDTIVQVRTEGDPRELAQRLEERIREVNPELPVYDVRPLYETTRLSMIFSQMDSAFASFFAVLGLILAGSGIYGVVAYRTQLRRHEIGIRMALGADRRDVLRLVLGQGVRLTAAGLTLGLVLSLGLTRFLRALLYGVSPTDPLTVAGVTALLGGMALAACWLPALRATRVNPVLAMRGE